MRITKVEAIELRLPEEQVLPIPSGVQDTLIIKIETDEGITGIGEVESAARVAKAVVNAPISNIFTSGLGRLLTGMDPLDIEPINDKLYRTSLFSGRGGIFIQTIAGIDIALWDIAGKYYKQPIYKLLGGAFRDKIPVYASIKFADTAEETKERGIACKEQGFKAVKFGYGPIGQSEKLDLKLIRAARESVEEIDFMIDAATRWDVTTAMRRTRQIEELNPLWIEEPLDPADYEGYRKLCSISGVPIAQGEAECGLINYCNLLEYGGVNVLQVDLARNGFTVARKVADMAELKNIKLSNHCFTTPINMVAGFHWLMSRKNTTFAEYSIQDGPLRNELVDPLPVAKDGFVSVGDGYGLGIELNEDIVKKYRVS